jgi:hypothetical protein
LKRPDRITDGTSRDIRLPALERWGGWAGVKIYARLADKEQVVAVFRDEIDQVVHLAGRATKEAGRRRLRLRRGVGMEESSRDWSVFMAVEHLVIVNRGITAVIHALCADHNPGVEIGIEDIQPHPDAGPEQVGALAQAAERYLEIVDRFGGLNCQERYQHPWFGALTACEWNVLAAWHNRIHRNQIQRLLKAHGIRYR